MSDGTLENRNNDSNSDTQPPPPPPDADADNEATTANGDTTTATNNTTTSDSTSSSMAKGLSSIISSVLRDFDSQAQDTVRSQDHLSFALDRLTRELDQLLEDAPLPFIMQQAAKISGVRKRVSSMNLVLKSIQRRVDNIDRMISAGLPHGMSLLLRTPCSSYRLEGDGLKFYRRLIEINLPVELLDNIKEGLRWTGRINFLCLEGSHASPGALLLASKMVNWGKA
ncbi:hypothetical protein LguiA_027477 [Lonicera macranthoides]